MKKIYFAFSFIFIGLSVNAQIINFPDPVFKAKLLASSALNICGFNQQGPIVIDSNGDGEIQVSEALQVTGMDAQSNIITSYEGIQAFANLRILNCSYSLATSLDVSNMTNLEQLTCSDGDLTSLNVSGCTSLSQLDCRYNQLASLDFNGMPLLRYLLSDSNPLTSLNVSNCPSLQQLLLRYTSLTVIDVSDSPNVETLYVAHCPQLSSIFAKNGGNESFIDFSNSPNVNYICVDESQLTTVQDLATQNGNINCTVNTYCSFTPGGNYFTIAGASTFDAANNGCDVNDPVFKGLRLAYSGAATGNITTSGLGNYAIDFPQGTYTVNPVLENPTYFNVTPTSLSATFPGATSPLTQDFCISPNGTHNDLEVTIFPLIAARPGFDARYSIIYKNKGTEAMSGNVTLEFQDDKMDYVTSNPVYTNQAINMFSWDYTNLLPFESREIKITFNLNSPVEAPSINIGDQLGFTAIVYPYIGDEVNVDNTSSLKQIVVGSFDPNDKTCLEGTTITLEMVGKEVHYLIRFENNGTANAENIVVKDLIDTSKFDVNSLIPTKGSHSFTTRITATNKVEFIFENINLPFDDANNDGYIAFKIKTKPSLVLGDTFSNSANIYFDYNAPITTNTALTTIQVLARQDFEFDRYFSLAPNPAKDVLHIVSNAAMAISSVSVYNALGQLIFVATNPNQTIDVSNLKTGMYFIRINAELGTTVSRFIKE